jgi:hypothetical protein
LIGKQKIGLTFNSDKLGGNDLKFFQNWPCAVPVLAGAGWYNGLGFLLGTAHGQFWKFCKIIAT